jgi:hypothetical protein
MGQRRVDRGGVVMAYGDLYPESFTIEDIKPGEVPAVRITYKLGQPGLEAMLQKMAAIHSEVTVSVEGDVMTVVLK